tara:strand:- start:722 stop:1000 length:279 start_codon:yes stop_codon:yes gene_type:complete
MKKEIKKLESILKEHEASENKRSVVLVYLSVVMLGKKFEAVSGYFGIPVLKVRASVAVLHKKLNNKNDRAFYLQMHEVMKDYFIVKHLKLVA